MISGNQLKVFTHLFIVSFCIVFGLFKASAECTLTIDEALELLSEQSWEGFWHSHDTTNTPRHSQVPRDNRQVIRTALVEISKEK